MFGQDIWVSNVANLLTAVSLTAAAITFLWSSVVAPLWRLSRWGEARLVSSLGRAFTYARFREILGREPNAYRDLGSRGHKAPDLRSRFFVLRTVYVEVFIDPDERVYGYTVNSRRSATAQIDVAGVRVRLGRTTLEQFWPKYVHPSRVGLPVTRGYSAFEISTGSGVSMDRTWAAGYGASGGRAGLTALATAKTRRQISRVLQDVARTFRMPKRTAVKTPSPDPYWELWNWALENDVAELGSIGALPPGYPISAISGIRSQIVVDSVAVAVQSEVRMAMLQQHNDDFHRYDPEPDSRLRRWLREDR